jgi:glycosyltransferase involved in cell wall biosynthesis
VPEEKQAQPAVLAVLVLYRCSLAESSTFHSLCKVRESGTGPLQVCIFDNSPFELQAEEKQLILENSDWISYSHFPENASLARLYNFGIRMGKNHDFMLILDQDSSFQPDFFASLYKADARHPEVDLFLPLVKHKDMIVSPGKWNGFKGRYLSSIHEGKWAARGMTAIASGMFVRYRFLQGGFAGFDERFQLYGIDTYLMQQFAVSGKDFFLLPYQLGHELAEYAGEPVEKKVFRFEEFVRGSLLLTEGAGFKRLNCYVFLTYKAIQNVLIHRRIAFLKVINLFFKPLS